MRNIAYIELQKYNNSVKEKIGGDEKKGGFYQKYLKYKMKYITLKKNIHGGTTPKFIRKGTYGSTYMPSFECKDTPVMPPPISKDADESTKMTYKIALNKYKNFYLGKIGKMMNNHNMNDEMNKTKYIRIIDPDQEYSLYPLYSCKVKPSSVFDSSGSYVPSINQCIDGTNPLDSTLPEDSMLLMYKYGGIDLENITIKVKDAKYFLLSIVRLFECLLFFQSKGIVHMDTKPSNIVILHSNNIFRPYLIDFGLTIKINEFFNIISYDYPLIDSDYFIWPPELRMLSHQFLSQRFRNKKTIPEIILNNNKKILTTYYNTINDQSIFFGISDKALYGYKNRNNLNRDLTTHLDIIFSFIWSTSSRVTPPELIQWLDIDYNEVRNWLNRFNINTRKTTSSDFILIAGSATERFIKKMMSCVDAFSLGVNLSFIFKKIIGIKTIDSSNNKYGIYSSKNHINNNAFTDELYLNLVIPFEKITCGLLNFRFIKRMTVEQALEEFKALLPVFNSYMSRKEFIDFYIERGMDEEEIDVKPFQQSPL
jgi:hypothetical protein